VDQLVFFEFVDCFESNHHSSGLKRDTGPVKWGGEVGTTLGADVSMQYLKSMYVMWGIFSGIEPLI